MQSSVTAPALLYLLHPYSSVSRKRAKKCRIRDEYGMFNRDTVTGIAGMI
ncbi:hypothetical protein L2703_04585 [Shewanella basaltis]|nr:hypothetical protein [Shewanella basaltis]MCL1112873.1 hypothetical protein [Shewanella basaltis]